MIVLLDNHGYAQIGGLSRSVGSGGFGTHYRYTRANGGGGRDGDRRCRSISPPTPSRSARA